MLPIKSFAKHSLLDYPVPDLIEAQRESYEWFLNFGLKELFEEISPIEDYTGKELELWFLNWIFGEPVFSDVEAKQNNATFESPLRAKIRLKNKKTQEIKEQEIYMGEFPLMTERGTFIVNGVERVVVSQLIRSPGVFFTMREYRGRKFFGAKIIPNRGAWIEFETDFNNVISVRIDRKRKVEATTLLRAFGMEKDEQIIELFRDVDTGAEVKYIQKTLQSDSAKNKDEALIEIYKRIRPGDLATVDNARSLIEAMFFNFARYDLSKVGRWRMIQRLKEFSVESPGITKVNRVLQKQDVVNVLKEIIKLNNNPEAEPDNIDHLGNRRVRSLGELLQNKLRIGLVRMERIIKDRMSTLDISILTPTQLLNISPFAAAVKEFFTSSQLAQFMDNQNPLAELEHKRRLSAMGPGGLVRERAGFEVRDVQPSHYGRICPIQTPEGPNIGLVGHLALFARINEFGFIETPYFKVKQGRVTSEIQYLNAYDEERYNIAQGGEKIDRQGRFLEQKIEARLKGEPGIIDSKDINFTDISSRQIFSVATNLIPFLAHDDANRALMGSNMQRQAVPCVKSEPPLVSTGIEERVAEDSKQVITAPEDARVLEVDAEHIKLELKEKKRTKLYKLNNFIRSNQYTCLHQKPIIKKGALVKKGEILADGSAIKDGILALGQNLLVAFLPWRGANFEDAIVISQRLLEEDIYSSIHIEDFTCDIRETKLGPEITTFDIPNVGEEKLKDLDEEGIIRIGAEVKPRSILVGKISPKGEADLTAEERLLKAIFGEKAREIKDTSLLLPHGKRGRVISVKVLSRKKGDKLEPGIIKSIRVEVAHLRKIAVGDKLAGRHGNKGVISKILPEEEMPYLEDGTPIDIILNPLSIASRMNIGQVLETHLGWVAKKLGYRAVTPSFGGATEEDIKEEFKKAKLPEDGKVVLYDGKTGEPFPQKITIGYAYIMKLVHMVEEKIHMRSIGPYSLITQQPLGGKAQFGGQRFGEMEVWALEGYGVAHILQEILTIKSDDVLGRAVTYESIIRGEKIKTPNVPSSFNVLISELRGLGLNVRPEEENKT
ncbi:MAG: DNA-directed RNA polymerase subunit beta [Parcubacteria group bacterium CG11_big_fil_rev_8_21_14_0_20_39_14]|nr:MAG: DNA-directed RNA polymerase subunit beta [Parcubacteria group bacterium CG11_big_fil_rev_8_21_14_0_20_39_14]PIS35681.1 MAG: DNA-directed RNA polymerase subunit beta [Parcubacteria group bacterium CG08_land_8_20_14_0_20_38_56]